jgi:hypothetical protein
MPPLYCYIAQMIKMYPFTNAVVSYIKNWPEECQRKGSDPYIIKMAQELMNDENGHDRLILKDLETLKIPVEMALNKFRSDSTQSLIAHFHQSVAANHLHLLAWMYCSETIAVAKVTAELLQEFQKILGPFHKAMRFWRIHSAVGPEVEHVKKRKQWIKALPACQRQSLLQEVDKVIYLYSNQHFDLDCEEFDRFISQHAPHLIDVASSYTARQ